MLESRGLAFYSLLHSAHNIPVEITAKHRYIEQKLRAAFGITAFRVCRFVFAIKLADELLAMASLWAILYRVATIVISLVDQQVSQM